MDSFSGTPEASSRRPPSSSSTTSRHSEVTMPAVVSHPGSSRLWFVFLVFSTVLAVACSKAVSVPQVRDTPEVAVQERQSSSYVFPDLRNASIHDLQNGLGGGHFSSVDLVKVSSAPQKLIHSLGIECIC